MELIYLSHFLYNFLIKIFLTLYSINWPNLIVWLFLFREILGNVCIIIAFYPALKNIFHHFFKFFTEEIKQPFLESESPTLTILSIIVYYILCSDHNHHEKSDRKWKFLFKISVNVRDCMIMILQKTCEFCGILIFHFPDRFV